MAIIHNVVDLQQKKCHVCSNVDLDGFKKFTLKPQERREVRLGFISFCETQISASPSISCCDVSGDHHIDVLGDGNS